MKDVQVNEVQGSRYNRKRVIAITIVIAIALTAAAIVAAVMADGNIGDDAANDTGSIVAKDTATAKPTPGKEGATEESKSSSGKAAGTEDDGSYDSGSTTQGSSGSSDSSTSTDHQEGSDYQSSKHWVIDYKQVWVEDSAAWDEQVPIYSQREISICNICGATITGSETAHAKQHMLAGEGSGHHTEVISEIIGYETVHHDAIGHWETIEDGGHWK